MDSIFIGDSIMANYDELRHLNKINNLAVPGNKIIDLFPLIITLKRSYPKKLFIHIGINDYLLKKGAFDITMDTLLLDSYSLFLRIIAMALPKTKVYVISLLPIKSLFGKDNDNIDSINSKLLEILQNYNINFININPLFKDENGDLITALTTDGIHLNKQGYQVLHKSLEAYLEEVV